MVMKFDSTLSTTHPLLEQGTCCTFVWDDSFEVHRGVMRNYTCVCGDFDRILYKDKTLAINKKIACILDIMDSIMFPEQSGDLYNAFLGTRAWLAHDQLSRLLSSVPDAKRLAEEVLDTITSEQHAEELSLKLRTSCRSLRQFLEAVESNLPDQHSIRFCRMD